MIREGLEVRSRTFQQREIRKLLRVGGGERTKQLTLHQLCFDDARLDTPQTRSVLIKDSLLSRVTR